MQSLLWKSNGYLNQFLAYRLFNAGNSRGCERDFSIVVRCAPRRKSLPRRVRR